MVLEKHNNTPVKTHQRLREIYSDVSWAISLIDGEDCLYIRMTDYHAEPLTLPLSRLKKYIEAVDNLASDETPIKLKTEKPKDVVEIRRQGQWSLALSKKNKCLIVKTPYDDEEPLLLSRKELYEIGKMMSKRKKVRNMTDAFSRADNR